MSSRNTDSDPRKPTVNQPPGRSIKQDKAKKEKDDKKSEKEKKKEKDKEKDKEKKKDTNKPTKPESSAKRK